MKTVKFALASTFFLLGFGASAQTAALFADAGELSSMSLDDLLRVEVQSASRYAQPMAESPASVTVIQTDELRQHGYRNLAEALATVPGVYLSNDRNYTYLGVRGFNRPGDYNSRVLLLTDGARRNDALYDQAQVGNESPIEIDWVKRLEFISGPASAVYGANALFGIVNAVMMDGGDIHGTRLTADVGSGQSARLGLLAGQRIDGGGDWLFGFSAYNSRGTDLYFKEFDNGTTDGWARGLDGEKYTKVYGKLRLGDWRLTGSFSSREKNIPNASFETSFGQPGTRTLDQHALIELAYDGRLSNGWQQQFRTFVGNYRYDGNYRYTGALDNVDSGRANWVGADYRLTITTLQDHKLLLGAEAQRNTQLAQVNVDVAPAAIHLDSDRPSRTYGIFVQDEWRFRKQWILNAGLRYDKHSDYEGITSPRVALIYQPHDGAVLKGMIGSAYRAPNVYERFYDDGGVVQKANPTLMPERILSTELAGDFRISQTGRVGFSLYRNEMRNMIDQVIDPADGLAVFTNQADVTAHGIELNAEKRWSDGHRLRGSMAWQQSRTADGAELGNSPRLLAKLIFGLPVSSGWTLGGEWLGMSDRRSLAARVPGNGILNLTLTSARLGSFGELSLGLYNVGDRRYADPASSAFVQDTLGQDGRQFRLRWTLPL